MLILYLIVCIFGSGHGRCGCLVTWFCYQPIAKPGNNTAAPPWPEPFDVFLCKFYASIRLSGSSLFSSFSCLFLVSLSKLYFYNFFRTLPINMGHGLYFKFSGPWQMWLYHEMCNFPAYFSDSLMLRWLPQGSLMISQHWFRQWCTQESSH